MRKHIKKLTILALSTSLLFLTSCTSIDAYFDGKKKTLNAKDIAFYVPSSSTISELKILLIDNNIIEDTAAFQSVLDYKDFTNNQIGAGKYIIQPNTSYRTLINGFTKNTLGNGNQEVEVNVTFNNCRDVYDLAGKVAQNIEMDSTAFINYILSDTVLNKYGFSKERIGALFLPNTYRFYWDTDVNEFVARMAKEFKKFWSPDRMEKLKHVGLNSQSDVVTLASIVYKEQDKYPEEWKTIAGLYLNRIRKGMKLESDPTFRFCWNDQLDGVERLTYAHRAIDCPYNTYLYPGLPPGPICIPPAKVVDAVLNAENNDYIFMCAKPNTNGLHNFAKTLAQHNRNASKYHQWLNSLKK